MAKPNTGVPLYISQCTRRSGVTVLVVVGHGLTGADVGRRLTVVGVSHQNANGEFAISAVRGTDTIEYPQPGLADIPSGLTGGAVGIN